MRVGYLVPVVFDERGVGLLELCIDGRKVVELCKECFGSGTQFLVLDRILNERELFS